MISVSLARELGTLGTDSNDADPRWGHCWGQNGDTRYGGSVKNDNGMTDEEQKILDNHLATLELARRLGLTAYAVHAMDEPERPRIRVEVPQVVGVDGVLEDVDGDFCLYADSPEDLLRALGYIADPEWDDALARARDLDELSRLQ